MLVSSAIVHVLGLQNATRALDYCDTNLHSKLHLIKFFKAHFGRFQFRNGNGSDAQSKHEISLLFSTSSITEFHRRTVFSVEVEGL